MAIPRIKKDTLRRLLPGLLALAAAFAAWGQLELSDATPAAFLAGQWPVYAPLGAATAFCLTLLLYALLGRWSRATAAAGAAFTVLAIANTYTRDLHGTAVMPQDVLNLGTAAEVLGSYTLHITPAIAAIAALYLPVLAVAAVQSHLEKTRHTNGLRPAKRRLRRAAGCLAGIAAILWGGYFAPFAPVPAPQNGWHWQQTYYTYGYLPGTVQVCRLLADPVVRPAGYSDAAAEQAAAEAAALAEPGRAAEPYPDVLLVLSESWYDLSLVTDPQADADCFANARALPGALHGHAVSPHVGGGTNTSEYTLLTGNSPLLLPSITPFNSLDLNGAESLVRYFEQLGYATMAAHPYTAGNYRRDTGWAALGFDETHFGGDFPTGGTWGDRPYRTDAAAYADWLDQYEAMPADRPRFAFLVSIQSHGDYEVNDAALDTVHAATDYGFYDAAVDEYLSCVRLTDEALPVLTERLRALYAENGRRAVLVIVGDHAPSFVDHIADRGLPYAERLTLERSTPYLVWANYPLEGGAAGLPEPVDLAALGPLALRAAGLPLTPCQGALWALQGREALYAYDQEAGPTEAQRRYFYLEYNALTAGAQRLRQAFEPPR